MAPLPKIKKEIILKEAFIITKKHGLDALNVRGLAKELNCSTQPILYYYKNMKELKNDVVDEASNFFYKSIFERNYNKEVYKDIGINFIRFAKNEPVLFKLLFDSNSSEVLNSFMNLTGPLEIVKQTISNQTSLSLDETQRFHKSMWLYSNGIANLIANNICDFTDDEIEMLIKNQYVSQMLLEIQNGNIKKEVLDNVMKNELKRKEK